MLGSRYTFPMLHTNRDCRCWDESKVAPVWHRFLYSYLCVSMSKAKEIKQAVQKKVEEDKHEED